MIVEICPYQSSDESEWDAFCSAAYQSTLLHSRRFISYHGDRFDDCSLVIKDEGRWIGVFPAAISPNDGHCVISHPGLTYGGMVHRGALKGERMLVALASICSKYADSGFRTLLYKPVPRFYHTTPAEDDLYALFRLGARRTRCDLSSTIDLDQRMPVSERRKRSLKKAIRAGVSVAEGPEYVSALWPILAENLARKHGVAPVHSLSEITLLAERFPNHISCIVGLLNGKVEAGILLFSTPGVDHAQYIASSEAGYDAAVLDSVFESAIQRATSSGKRWFDFGISTEKSGMQLNEGLYKFKSEFGGGGTVHEFFEIDLRETNYVDQ